jgi:hypothetical protein
MQEAVVPAKFLTEILLLGQHIIGGDKLARKIANALDYCAAQ